MRPAILLLIVFAAVAAVLLAQSRRPAKCNVQAELEIGRAFDIRGSL